MQKHIEYLCPNCEAPMEEIEEDICYCHNCEKQVLKEETMPNTIYY